VLKSWQICDGIAPNRPGTGAEAHPDRPFDYCLEASRHVSNTSRTTVSAASATIGSCVASETAAPISLHPASAALLSSLCQLS
jgi:hypothetical protein